jgi:ABC-type nickel/cobalt efflux system permease component RcnA
MSLPIRIVLFVITVLLFALAMLWRSPAHSQEAGFEPPAEIHVRMHKETHRIHRHPRAGHAKPHKVPVRRGDTHQGLTAGSIPATGASNAAYIEWLEMELMKARRECTCLGFSNGRK